MSENANVNINDNSRQKMSSDKNIDANAAKTETSLSSTQNSGVSGEREDEVDVASSSVNDLNKKSDAIDEKLDERCASDSSSHSQTETCASENRGMENDARQELEGTAPQAVSAAADSSETKIKEYTQEKLKMNIGIDGISSTQQPASENCSSHSSPELEGTAPQAVSAAADSSETKIKENTQEKLKMNIGIDGNSSTQQPASENCSSHSSPELEGTAPQAVSAAADSSETKIKENTQEKLKMNIGIDGNSSTQQPASENCSSHSSPGKSSGEENVEEANDKGESVKEDRGTSETANKHNPEGRDSPTKIDEQSDNADGNCGKEKGKSDSENDENCDETASAKELTKKNSHHEGEDKKINVGSGVTSVPKSESGRKEEESTEIMEASGVAEDYQKLEKETVKNEDSNFKPSSFIPPRIARIRRQYSEYDTKLYRDGYPGKQDDPNLTLNMDFYKGQIKCRPDGDFIDNIHELWWDDYELLEVHHGYIQWLFPIRESGMNYQAQELQLHEVEAIWTDEEAMKRLKKSYEMMLNFYGVHLLSDESGEVERAQNWKERFRHLNYSMHNYLRITRILKCLGEMGLEEFKAPFLRFMLFEAIVTGYLDRTLDSCYNYWIGTVKDDKERQSIYDYATQLALQAESEKSKDFPNLRCSLD